VGERRDTTSFKTQDSARARAWIEVDLDAVRRNAVRIAEHAAPARLLPMIKADGYGLGALEIARTLSPLRPYGFGVATVDEGRELRAGGVSDRVIVFSPCAAIDADALVELALEPAVLGPNALERLGPLGIGLHLEIDTGMGRAGVRWDRAESWAPRLAEMIDEGARLESAFTHFHSAGVDEVATREQLARFEAALGTLSEAGVDVPVRHSGNSDAIGAAPQYHLDVVRPGLYLYGGGRGGDPASGLPAPEPAVRVRARILEIRDLAPSSTVSYGATYVTSGPERIGTLGIGYADGLPWRLSNRGSVLIRGTRAPIRGAVCMDVTSVDVSEVPGVEAGEATTLFGVEGEGRISLSELAAAADTIEYDVLTGLGKRLPRVYLRGDADREPRMSEGHGGNR
jgi:alanine racemase